MIKLDCPAKKLNNQPEENCFNQILFDITNHSQVKKRPPAISTHYAEIEDRINSYFKSNGNPENLAPSPFLSPKIKKKTGKFLKGRYKANSPICKEIKTHLESTHCPYCGLHLDSDFEYDHILPKSIYPEYTLLISNLVAVCSKCNRNKGNKLFGPGRQWLFIHPYYDLILRQNILSVTINLGNSAWSPEFSISNNIQANFRSRLDSHITILKIFKRYQSPVREVNLFLKGYQDSWNKNRSSLGEIRKKFSDIAQEVLSHHPNDPTYLIIQALSTTSHLSNILSLK